MTKYRKKPIVIDAIQIPEDGKEFVLSVADIFEFMDGSEWMTTQDRGIDITTLEGVMHASPGDWIIRGVQGEHYPCKPDIFAATYDALPDPAALRPT